jgi:hypothetical protein
MNKKLAELKKFIQKNWIFVLVLILLVAFVTYYGVKDSFGMFNMSAFNEGDYE